jgi:two-component system, LytTR family, sensor histidine kinase AlgZ
VILGLADWSAALLFALPAFQIFGFIAASAYYVCRSLPLPQRSFQNGLLVFGSASVLSAFAWVCFCLLLNSASNYLGLGWLGIIMNSQLIVSLFVIGSLLYLVSLLGHDVYIAFDNMHDAERKHSAAQVLARDAELQVLRSQINPHFLFNSLNSISALTAIDPSAARSMVIELGNFFRKSLAISSHSHIRLSEELGLCEHYLAVEKIRFGERLQTSITTEPEALPAKVPPMFLQPLVENAIKHSIGNLCDGGTITIIVTVHETWLYIAISNPTGLTPSTAEGTGTGLKNLKARFENLYGERARINWGLAQTVFRIELIIPLEY